MSDSRQDPGSERPTTEVYASADRARLEAELLRQQGVENAPLINAEDEQLEPPAPHVLDRRVMVKWASITLAIYILVRLIVGPVREAVVDAVREEIKNQAAPVTNTAIPPVPTPPTPPVAPTTVKPEVPQGTAAPEAPPATRERTRVRIQR
jgi:hypothetical protein